MRVKAVGPQATTCLTSPTCPTRPSHNRACVGTTAIRSWCGSYRAPTPRISSKNGSAASPNGSARWSDRRCPVPPFWPSTPSPSYGCSSPCGCPRATKSRAGWRSRSRPIIGVNGVGHILGSLATRSYSPGLITGVVLYLPLAKLLLMRAWLQARRETWRIGVVSGIVLHALVIVVASSMTS